MKNVLRYVLCAVLVIAMIGLGLFSSLMNFKLLGAAWDWIEDRFSIKGEAVTLYSLMEPLNNNLCDYHSLQLDDYSKSIPEYVKGLTGLQDCTMTHVGLFDSESQCYYKLQLGDAFAYVAFMGDSEIVRSIVFFCDIDDALRCNQNYQGLALALPFLCSDMINANGGSISAAQQTNMLMQIAEYFSDGNTENSFTYNKDGFLLDIFFEPAEDAKTIYDGSICIWFDMA